MRQGVRMRIPTLFFGELWTKVDGGLTDRDHPASNGVRWGGSHETKI